MHCTFPGHEEINPGAQSFDYSRLDCEMLDGGSMVPLRLTPCAARDLSLPFLSESSFPSQSSVCDMAARRPRPLLFL